jgi:tetratricopeptide (TPR) repeat protein
LQVIYYRFKVAIILLALFVDLSPLLLAQEEYGKYKELFERGLRDYREKKFDLAVGEFKKVSQEIFGHEPSLYNLGLCYAHQNKYHQALETFQEASLYNPYNIFSRKFIADLLILTENYKDARDKLKEIIERNPQDTGAHLKAGLLALKENDLDTAMREFAFVRNLDPQDVAGRLNLVGLLVQKKDLDKAKEYLDEVRARTLEDVRLDAFRWGLLSYLHRLAGRTQEAQDAHKAAIELVPDWKGLKDPLFRLPTLQLELAQYLLRAHSASELLEAQPLGFQQSEVSRRVVERILKEKEEKAKRAVVKQEVKKMPLGLTGELNHTFEYYDRNPATSNPINDLNMTSNLKLETKIEKARLKMEFEGYYNRWDHTELDYFKINLKDTDDEIDIGKFSAKNFPGLLSHPTIEQGFRWWHRYQRPEKAELFEGLPEDLEFSGLEEIPNLSQLYSRVYRSRQLFNTWEITVLSGRSKKPRNLNRPKPKNDRTYETSGQFEQWVNAFHIMTQLTDICELGFSYSRVKDDETSATVSSTTYPIESEAIGMDWAIEFLDGRLSADGEFVWSNYDENVSSADDVKNKRDFATTFGLDYELTKDWDLSYDLKRIGTNYEVEGAYQTEDKITHTWTAKYSAPRSNPWTIRSIDLKLEPAKTNLPGSDTTSKRYLTFQPKVSFTLPQEVKLSFDYKYYDEDWTCWCTRYRTRTLKTDLEYEWKKIKTTFKPSYTFERKDDRVASPTDEEKQDYKLSIENELIKNLTLKVDLERERKNYVGANTKSYNQHKYSLEAKYSFIPNRCDATFKASMDDKDQTDTNDIELDTLKFSFNYTSQDGNRKLSLEYERKLNIYEPWSDTSAYRQNYTKLKFTQKF